MASIRYRPARADDAPALSRIAMEAKAGWDYPGDWLEAWKDELTFTPEYLDRHWARVAEADGDLIGVASISQRNGRCELDHCWVTPAHQGTGVGRELFTLAWKEARGRGLPLLVESDPAAEGFYTSLGGERIGIVVSSVLGNRRELPLLEFPSGR